MIIRQSITDRDPVIGWDNLVTAANISATTASTDFPAANLANPSTHLKWRSGADSPANDEFLTITGLSATVDYVGVAQHNFGSIGATCTVQYLTANSPADWHDATTATVITDDTPLIFQFAPITATGIRLRVQRPSSAYIEAAVLYVGDILTLERSLRIDMNHTPINLGTVSDIISGTSESGQFVGRMVRNQYKASKADFWYFTNASYRADFDEFVVNAVDNPFFFAWAPQNYPTDVGYCWLTKDPKPEFHLPTERFLVSLEMRGIA